MNLWWESTHHKLRSKWWLWAVLWLIDDLLHSAHASSREFWRTRSIPAVGGLAAYILSNPATVAVLTAIFVITSLAVLSYLETRPSKRPGHLRSKIVKLAGELFMILAESGYELESQQSVNDRTGWENIPPDPVILAASSQHRVRDRLAGIKADLAFYGLQSRPVFILDMEVSDSEDVRTVIRGLCELVKVVNSRFSGLLAQQGLA